MKNGWLQPSTADYSWLQWILTAANGFLRSKYLIEQLWFSEVGSKIAYYSWLQPITADYSWLQWILTAVNGFLRSAYPIEQLWFCEVRLNEAIRFSLGEHDTRQTQMPPEYRALQPQLSCSWGWVEQLTITADYSWLQLIKVNINSCKGLPEVYLSHWAT